MARSDAGLTLVELVVVIAIIGVLGAVALPRFANMTGSAKQATFDAVQGGFATSVYSVHSLWVASGSPGAVALTVEGTAVEVNTAGWPRIDAAAANQMSAAELYETILSTTLPTDWTSSDGGNMADYTYEGMTFTYDAANGQVFTAP